MLKKNYLIILAVVIVLIAGVAADVLFWKHIAKENQVKQDLWQTKIEALTAQITRQQAELTALQTKVTQNYSQPIVTEIAYLLDIADLYLQINHDSTNAIKSLQLAQRLAPPSLQQVITSDLNRLTAAPKIDTAEVLVTLQGLSASISQQTWTAPNITAPTQEMATSSAKPAAWYQKIFQSLWAKFKKIVVVHHNDSDMPQSQQHEWIRENITFNLALAQWAVLQQKSALYQHSLAQVRAEIISNYPDSPERQSILDRLEKLIALDIAPTPPDISASLSAVKQALQAGPATSSPLPSVAPSPSPTQPEKPQTPTGIEI